MTYYFCSWGEGGDSDHTTIKHGQAEVGAWVRGQLGSAGIGCPEWIASEVDTLDAQASWGGAPTRIVWLADDYMISITEITDLGAWAPGTLTGSQRQAIINECQVALRSLESHQYHTDASVNAKKSMAVALYLLGGRAEHGLSLEDVDAAVRGQEPVVDADALSAVRERFEDARRVVDAALASLDIC